MPNTVNLEENLLVADMGDTKVDDLEILEFFQVGPAANIAALWFMTISVVPSSCRNPSQASKLKQHNYLNYIYGFQFRCNVMNKCNI